MPILGTGTDIVEVVRIEKLIAAHAEKFIEKIFTKEEIKADAPASYYAKRFAAKEACLKALGTGMRQGLHWHDMVVTNDELGKPVLTLTGGALKATGIAAPNIHLSLSDEKEYALAFVIIEG